MKNIVENETDNNKTIIKEFNNSRELNREIRLNNRLQKNKVNLALELVEIKNNTIIYSEIEGQKLSEIKELDIDTYYKVGYELSKFHSIRLGTKSKTLPIFYQIQMIEELNKFSKGIEENNIKNIIETLKDSLDKVAFRNMRFGLTLFEMNKEDIIIYEGEVYISTKKELLYNNQETNYNIFGTEIFENIANLESFFKGYNKILRTDEDVFKRMKIFMIFKLLKEMYLKRTNIDICTLESLLIKL